MARAEILREQGQFTEAISVYEEAISYLRHNDVELFDSVLQHRAKAINAFANASGFYEKAVEILAADRSPEHHLDTHSFSILMKLAPDYETAKGHYDELGGLDLAPDIITLSTLISKAPDYETAKGHYDELGEQNLDVDLAVLSEMISRAPDYQSAKQYYEKAKASKLAPDEIFFNVLIDRSDSYPVARGWYNEMRKAGLVPNRFIVTTLVRQSTSFGDRFALVRKLIADGQRAGEMVYGALMAKTRDYAIVTEIISRMKRTGLKPDLFIYRHAISCAGSMEKALPIVKEMVSECIEPDDYTWRFLARYGIYYEDI